MNSEELMPLTDADAAQELDTLCRLFPEYERNHIRGALRAARAALAECEGHTALMHVLQQKLQ